jgi:hypothetical protein
MDCSKFKDGQANPLHKFNRLKGCNTFLKWSAVLSVKKDKNKNPIDCVPGYIATWKKYLCLQS